MKTLMIVEDEQDIRESLCAFISRHCEVKVFSAANGQEAIDVYKVERPDCVFLDLGLPDMNGLKVLEIIKSMNAQAMVYIVSGFDGAEVKQKAKELGAQKYINKPVLFDELMAIMTAG